MDERLVELAERGLGQPEPSGHARVDEHEGPVGHDARTLPSAVHGSDAPRILVVTLAVSAVVAVVIVRQRPLRGPGAARGGARAGSPLHGRHLASAWRARRRPGAGTGTLVLTDAEVAFAQWRPDRLVRIPRPAIAEVDTTRSHLGKTMNADLLRIRWTTPKATDTVAFFVRDLDPWLADLGGHRGADSEP